MHPALPPALRNLLCGPLLLMLSLRPVVAQSEDTGPSAFPLVSRAVEAKQSQRFIARQDIFLSDWMGRAEVTTRIVADVVRDEIRVRLCYQCPGTVAGRIEVDDGHTFRQWEPTRHMVLVDQSHEAAGPQRQMLRLLRQNYHCLSLGTQIVNGLPCDLIAIRARYRYGGERRLWIDRVHHAILRTEEYDTEGRCRYLSFYERFRFVTHVAPALFCLTRLGRTRGVPRLMREMPDFRSAFLGAGLRGRLPAWLPDGYALVGCALADGGQAVMLRYGDGLQTFCLFEERPMPSADSGSPAPRPPLHGQVARYGQRIWEEIDPELHVTVVGDALLPDALGQDLLTALTPDLVPLLRSRLLRDFGPQALATAMRLRGRGWGFDQIVSLDLYLRAHPEKAPVAGTCWSRGLGWTQTLSRLRAPADALDRRARAWVAAALSAHRAAADR